LLHSSGNMRAVVITRLGGPEVLEIRDVPAPVSNEQELVRVEAAGVNFADIMAARGGYPGTPAPPLVAGREFSGTRVGNGELVMGYTQWGAFAELVAARSHLLWPVPAGWSAREGAAFPVNFFTAYFAYWKSGLLDAAENTRVLIHAVAGGVGTAAVEIGRLLGVEMYGTSSSDAKLERIKQLGLHHAINYSREDYEEAVKDLTRGEGVDVVFEMLGGEHTAKSVRCLRDFGRVIVYGTATGERARFDPGVLYARGASVHGLWLTYLSAKPALMKAAWSKLANWAAEGHLRPLVETALPIEKAGDAYRLLIERKNIGKVVLEFRGRST
jgi:NADPH:quinone reductase